MDGNSQAKSRIELFHEILEGRMVSDVARELGCSRQNVHARLREYLQQKNSEGYAELMDNGQHPPMYKLRINRERFSKEGRNESSK